MSQFTFALLAFATVWLSSCDDDEVERSGTYSLASAAYEVSENAAAPLEIPIAISSTWDAVVTIPFSVSGSAIEGVDYATIATKSVTIARGQTQGVITITPLNNNFVETAARTLTISLVAPADNRLDPGATTSTTVTITNDDAAGTVVAQFDAAEYVTNEYLKESVPVRVALSATFPEAVTLSFNVTGTAQSGTHYEALAAATVTIPAGQTSATIPVTIKDTKAYGQTSQIQFTLTAPENTAISLGTQVSASVKIINPVANLIPWIKDAAVPNNLLYAYGTYADVEVPETGRSNTDATLGTQFGESFAAVYYEYGRDNTKDPNAFGYRSTIWAEDDPYKSTNVFNMHRLYGNTGLPSSKNEGVTAASAGIVILNAIRLIPLTEGATSGKAVIIPQEVTVYRPDTTGDAIANPTSFQVGITGEGTYNEATGLIQLRIVFDETSIGNGTQIRRYTIPSIRR